ncbi:DUF973 family protein [Caldivirga sp.]|uniref:DUF973 family protein n=1 Tax=Caldivirga sp. TaxID=2080243 RepID=UPI0025BCE6B6|nr:DUF973 family protein [Caldivirga sp.]
MHKGISKIRIGYALDLVAYIIVTSLVAVIIGFIPAILTNTTAALPSLLLGVTSEFSWLLLGLVIMLVIIIIMGIVAMVFKVMGFLTLAKVNETRYGAVSVGLAAIILAYILGVLLLVLVIYTLMHNPQLMLKMAPPLIMLTVTIIVLAIVGNAVLSVILWRLSDDYRSSTLLVGGVLIILTVVNTVLGFLGTIAVVMGLSEVMNRVSSIVEEEG